MKLVKCALCDRLFLPDDDYKQEYKDDPKKYYWNLCPGCFEVETFASSLAEGCAYE